MKTPSKQVINRDIKTSMNLLLRSDQLQRPIEVTSKFKRLIREERELICRQLQVIGWRFKTSLPIIKPISYEMAQFATNHRNFAKRSSINDTSVKPNNTQIDTKILIDFVKNHSQLQNFTVQVVIEPIQYRLSDIGCLPFAQIIYLLKEMMIGYDVLMDIFGVFEPSDEMIGVNNNNQWRVWMSEDYTLNLKSEKNINLGEKEFIYKLIFIGEKHCTPTSLSKVFFSDMKEFTYNKECTFIKILEKIKEFTNVNKIFQCNKVIIQSDKKISDSIQLQKKRSFIPISPNNSINNLKYQKKPGAFPNKPKLENSFFQFQSKSSTNLLNVNRNNTSMMVNHSKTNYPQKYLNISVLENSKHSSTHQCLSPQAQSNHFPNPFSNIKKINQRKDYKSKDNNINTSMNLKPSMLPKDDSRTAVKPLSPPPVLNRQAVSSINLNISKSRHQPTFFATPKRQNSPKVQVAALKKESIQKKPKKSTRKYSQQIVKVKSLQALRSKHITGSNIYMNDPESRVAVNVIKKEQVKDLNEDKKFLSPNYSSPSTQQVKHSKQHKNRNKEEDKYLSLKMNDLGCKLRNNQSSYYGMNGTKPQEKSNKNMAVSYSFNNKNDESIQNTSDKNDNKGNNWTKKISGLFSDDASIKHLKGSVKFRTAEEEIFEKEYLKDVKLQMLQKFGRPVRHSIVDEEDDFNTPYKSMQLIEQVFEDGKSHIEKQQDEQEVNLRSVRKRNQTVQIVACSKEQMIKSAISNKKECISEYCESQQINQDDGFNFETENYVINPKH